MRYGYKTLTCSVVFLLILSTLSFGKTDCTTKIEDYRNKISKSSKIEKDVKAEALRRLAEANKVCKEGQAMQADKLVKKLEQELLYKIIGDSIADH